MKAFLTLLALGWVLTISAASAATIEAGDLAVSLEADGTYQVVAKTPGWKLKGTLPGPAGGITSGKSSDALGECEQLFFTFTEDARAMRGTIRIYAARDLVLFSQTSPRARATAPAPFPDFTTLPTGLFFFGYADGPFSPPRFRFEKNGGPCLLFDAQDHALILSPASHFVCASLVGDGKTELGSGFQETLANLPANFTQQTVLTIGQGINRTWDLWGHALTDLQGKKRPANDADPFLKYYGYWTDNGGAYWYHYDADKGYQGTLQAVVDTYRAEQIPLRYLQLDSWWYHKSLTRFDGKEGGPKNKALPEGEWNRYGGTLDYTADRFVFPDGLAAFHEKTGLPFITHNRWIDPASPYHARYKFSGIAAIDPGFWREVAAYLKANGVRGYEQDWLNEILGHSPELSSTLDQGDAFFDGMAHACQEQGLSMQYCMGTPRCFLQGSKYENLTTIRASGDRFEPRKYRSFLYTSRLAAALGIWPWTDVYKSTEITNLLLGTLSAGPVGTGDALGAENKANLLKAMRADGVLIKPDVPLLPIDQAYLAEAHKEKVPLVATTYTDHDGLKTVYGVALKEKQEEGDSVVLNAGNLGCTGEIYVYDSFAGTGGKIAAGAPLTISLKDRDCAYFILAPVGATGIAFLGDPEKFVGTGKKRIAALRDDGQTVRAEVLLAAKEPAVTLHGYAAKTPTLITQGGKAAPIQYNAATGLFTVTVKPDSAEVPEKIDGDSVRKITVTFRTET